MTRKTRDIYTRVTKKATILTPKSDFMSSSSSWSLVTEEHRECLIDEQPESIMSVSTSVATS